VLVRLLLLLALFLLVDVTLADATEYVAAWWGSGTTCSAAAPCTVQTAVGKSVAGDTVSLLDGTYTGPDGMAVVSGKNGSAAAPITIRALTDGKVKVDGEHARYPFSCVNSSWIRTLGIDFVRGTYAVARHENCANVTHQRAVFRDADIRLNAAVFWNINSTDTWCEDCAIFGTGATTVQNGYNAGSRLVLRRAWIRFEGSTTNWSGKVAADLGYESAGAVCENCLVTATLLSMPATSYGVTDNDGRAVGSGLPGTFNGNCGVQGVQFTLTPPCPESIYRVRGGAGVPTHNHRMLGSLVYLPAGSTWAATGAAVLSATVPSAFDISGVRLQDSMVYISPSYPSFGSMRGFVLNSFGGSTSDLQYGRLSAVFGSGIQVFGGGWSNSLGSNSYGTALAKNGGTVADPWQTSGAGASLCSEYVDGLKTATPLLPWRMNDRILAATAEAGRYNGPCVNCTGAHGLRTAVDVNAELAALLGAAPSACVRGTPPADPPPADPPAPTPVPSDTAFPTASVLDNFNRANGALGASWTAVNGTGLVVASNRAAPPDTTTFHISKWASAFSADQEVFATVPVLPEVGATWLQVSLRLQDLNNRYAVNLARALGVDNDQILPYAVVGGVATLLCGGVPLNLGFDAVAGDKFGARVVGSVLEVWYQRSGQSWARVAACADTSIAAGGAIALGHGSFGAFDDFGGGNYAPTPATPGTMFPVVVERPAAAARPAAAQ